MKRFICVILSAVILLSCFCVMGASSAGNGAITVKLTNFGSELIFTDGLGGGFSVCGSDGVYVKAKTEIIAPDTVKISNEKVPEPVSASYAAYLSNGIDCADYRQIKEAEKRQAVRPLFPKMSFGDVFYDINIEVEKILPHGKSASEIKESTSENSISNPTEMSRVKPKIFP